METVIEKKFHILLLEDNHDHQELVLEAFQHDPVQFRVSVAGTVCEARDLIERDPPHLIIADWLLPDGKGLDILSCVNGIVTIPLIVMTSYGDETLAVEIMKSGAIDYVVKSAEMFRELPHISRRAIREWENFWERRVAQEAERATQKRLSDMLGFLPDAVLAIDDEGRVIAWNDAIERMTGVAAKDMLGKGNHEYSIPFYGERRPILIDLVLMKDPEIEKKYHFIQRDGGRITSETFIPTLFDGKGAYLWGTASPLHDIHGKCVGAIEVIRDITARKQNEDLQRQREITLKTLLNAPSDTIALLDRKGTIVDINEAGARRLGGAVQSMIGKCVYDLLPPDVAKVRKEHIDRVFETGNPVILDDERSGIYFHNEIFPIFNSEHTAVDHIAIFAQNITEQKKAEVAIRQAGAYNRSLIEASLDPLVTINPDGIISDVNSATVNVTGFSRDELIGTDFSKYFTEPAKAKAGYEQVFRDGSVRDYGLEIRHRDGKITPVLYNATVFKDKNGDVAGVFAAARDITERKKAESALRESEEKYRFLVENVEDVIWQTTSDLQFTYLSPAIQKITGYSKDELMGKSLFSIITEQSVIEVKKRLSDRKKEFDLGNKDFATVFEIEVMRKGGGRVWIEVGSTMVVGSDGAPIGFQGISRDITDRRRAEEALRDSQNRSAMLLEAIPDMMFIISRDGVYRDFSVPDPGVLAVPVDQIIGTNIHDSGLKKESTDAIMHYIGLTLDTKKLHQFEYELVVPDGERYYEARMVAFGEDSVLGIVRDITDRKRAEEALRESEKKFKTVADYTYDWEFWLLPDGQYQYISPSCERITGYKPEAFSENPDLFEKILHPDDCEFFQKHADSIETNAGPDEYTEFRIITRDGLTTWIGHLCRPIYSSDGEYLGRRGSNRDITERKLAEMALIESETRFRALIQNSSDLIRIIDKKGRIAYESTSAERILGYPSGYMTGRDPMAYIHPDDIARVKHDFQEVLERTNTGAPTEFRILKADGEYIWVDSIGTNLLDVPGVNGVVVTTRPIQQRKEAEEEIRKTISQLERSEALLRKVYDILPIGLWLADKNGTLQYGNPAGVKIWGAEPLVPIEQFGVFKARRFPSGEEIEPDDWALAHTIHEGVTIKDEMLEIDTFDGKKKIILNYTAPLNDSAGFIDGAIVVNQEITEKVIAEQALRENEARLATAMDITGLVNWEFDVATGMFTFDDRFYSLYATTVEREGGNLIPADTYLQEFVYPDDRPAVLASIRKILTTTDPNYLGKIEHRITPRDGSIRTIVARFAPIMSPDGKVIRTFGANQDITDFKLMESEIRSLNAVLEQRVKDRTKALEDEIAQRQEAEKKLQKSYDEKVLLLKEVHHRVKNNLQIIASLLNLQSRYITDESTLAAIRESQNRVKAMALVHEKLYRTEDISHISLHDYVRFLSNGLFQFYDARRQGIQFMLDIHDVNVDIDTAIPLGLILNELISNSLKYAFPNGRKGEISVRVRKENHTLTVQYCDNGIGIPANLDWRNTQSLGLRLVNTLVDQMNGTVELERNAGTRFTIVLQEKEQRNPT